MKHLRNPFFMLVALAVIILTIIYVMRSARYEQRKIDAIENIRLGKQELAS